MKLIKDMFWPNQGTTDGGRNLHRLWVGVAHTALGCCVGLLSLVVAALSYGKLDGGELFRSYFAIPMIPLLNLLFPVMLIWFFYFLTGRSWGGFLGSFLPVMGLTFANFYKIRLRNDPLLATDLRLISEAGGIVSGYTLEVTWLIWLTLGAFAAGMLFCLIFLRRRCRDRGFRLFALLSTAAIFGVSFVSLYANTAMYQKTANETLINGWSDTEIYVSRGCVYPFLYSARDMIYTPPQGYVEKDGAALLARYPDSDIPDERKVNVVGVMLEAFSDLTDFPVLADQPGVVSLYEPWHKLEKQSVSGDLLTNIFAGGTVDSEWCFLTGYSQYDDFRGKTQSYVWYLRDQGYDTLFHHPGFSWFYNRQNVNEYLGFQRSWFSENHYATFVEPVAAQWHSDDVLVDQILFDLNDRWTEGDTAFSFSVSYQNHGPYGETNSMPYFDPNTSGLSEETCDVWNSYLKGIDSTIEEMTRLVEALEHSGEPTVLVLFGDHKPWGGNGNSAYVEIGADFSISSTDSLYQYYSTPYLIWANSAAKDVLGGDWTGDGGDFSPCFLMNKVFSLCGWDGPGYMTLGNQVSAATGLVHQRGLYLVDGQLTDTLPEQTEELVNQFLRAQYYRENKMTPVD